MKNLLTITTILVFFVLGALQTSTINAHKEEINKLRKRVHNLEIVVNHNIKLEVKKQPNPNDKGFTG